MKTEMNQIAHRIQSQRDAINQAVEREFASHWYPGRIDGATFRFELDGRALVTLVAVLCDYPILWSDWQNLVAVPVDFDALIYYASERTRLYQERGFLEDQLARAACHADRRRLAKGINNVDGRLGRCQEYGYDGGLAYCINVRISIPLADWLLLRALGYVFANDESLWEDFRAVVQRKIQARMKRVS